MAFSTFVFDTLDVATRLGRYILQELFGWRRTPPGGGGDARDRRPPLAVRCVGAPAPAEAAYMDFWTLFGTRTSCSRR